MEFDLLIESDKSASEYADLLRSLLEEILHIEILQKKDSDTISIGCTFFTMWIELEDDFGLIMAKDTYDFNANIETRIQVFGKTYDKGLKILFQLLKSLSDYDDNLLLEENGSFIVLKKVGNEFVSEVLSTQRAEYPFSILKAEVKFTTME